MEAKLIDVAQRSARVDSGRCG
eukprot:SAG31_NODE_23682_length_498_cov_1.764411_1_plen_21_part_10